MLITFLAESKSVNCEDALNDSKWRSAIKEELDSIESNQT